MLRQDIQRDVVTNKPWVYVFKSPWKRILYIGKAKNIKKRLQQYFTPSSLWKQDMVAKAWFVEWFPTVNEEEALILENQMINHHKPPYNNLIKGTSSYVYVKISGHTFPKISIERYKKKDKAIYIGPKARRGDIRKFLHMTRHLFQRRSCSSMDYNKGILCSDYYFWLCKGRCAIEKKTPVKQPLPTFDEAVANKNESLGVLRSLFAWRTKVFNTYITKEIEQAVQQENYERAAKLRDMYTHAQHLADKQTVVFDKDIEAIYASIHPHGKYYIWVVLTIREWRIIDIIGFHEHQVDTSIEALIAQINREYEVTLQYNPDTEESRYASKQSITKKSLKTLEENTQRFLDWYTFSRFASEDPASRQILLQKIKDYYELPTLPTHIECVDISHFAGEQTVAWLTSMKQWVLHKAWYKRFKINEAKGWDDYGALKETLERRFFKWKNQTVLPDLFVIDWWIGQLNVIKTLLDNNPKKAKNLTKITFAGLWKGKARSRKEKVAWATEELHVLQKDWSIKTYPLLYNDEDKILVILRDEAHRFANNYRKKLDYKRYWN